MDNYSYDPSMMHFLEDKKQAIANFPGHQNSYQAQANTNGVSIKMEDSELRHLSKSQMAHLRESPAARSRRLARNAERMREKRAKESYDEYRMRLDKNALNNRMKRHGESATEKAIRQVRDAARQRLRRAMESPEQRGNRLQKLAERMRTIRRSEPTDRKADRLAKAAQRARERIQRETSEERKIRLQKSSDYARRVRSSKSKSSSCSISEDIDTSSEMLDQKPIINKVEVIYANPDAPTCSSQSQQQVYHHHQQPPSIYHQQVLTIPSLAHSKNEKLMSNIAPSNRIQQNNQYLPNIQFSYPYPGSGGAGNINYAIPPLALTGAGLDGTNANFVIQQQQGGVATLNIPQYHTLLNVPGSTGKDMLPISKIKVEPVSIIQPNHISDGVLHHHHRSKSKPKKEEPAVMLAHSLLPGFKPDNNLVLEHGVPAVRRTRGRVRETEEERAERLRKTAEASRLRRKLETPEQRAKRLSDLKERARERRDMIKAVETEDERKMRLAKQAEYARYRRMKTNSPEGKQDIDRRARELYAKLHDMHHHHQHQSSSSSSTSSSSSALLDKPSVLTILEPIIEMNTTI